MKNDKKSFNPEYKTLAILDKYKLQDKSKTTIPSKEAVEYAKDFVEENQK